MDLDVRNLRRVAGASAALVLALQGGTAALALSRGRRDYADGVWGPGLAGVALTSAALGHGDVRRRWLTAAITTGWAARLSSLMLGRLKDSDEEDPRYTEFLEGDGTAAVLVKVFGTQALAQVLVSAPLQLSAASRVSSGRRRWLLPVGLATMVTGAVVEALADRHKAAFMAEKKRAKEQSEDGEAPDDLQVLDSGLWGWSRHPNYFGDSLMWDGVFLTAAASSPGAWAWPAPVAMSYFLIYATGAKRTEERMQERPAYQDYQKRVAFFFPWPKKKS